MAKASGYGFGVSASTLELVLLGVGGFLLYKQISKDLGNFPTSLEHSLAQGVGALGNDVSQAVGNWWNTAGGTYKQISVDAPTTQELAQNAVIQYTIATQPSNDILSALRTTEWANNLGSQLYSRGRSG